MQKVPAVTQVRISLKDGLTVLDLKPENTVTLAQLRQIIKNSGFVSKDATIVARGTPSTDRKTFHVGGTDERLALTAVPVQRGDEWDLRVGTPEKR